MDKPARMTGTSAQWIAALQVSARIHPKPSDPLAAVNHRPNAMHRIRATVREHARRTTVRIRRPAHLMT
jgi:hypothetical protein